MNRGILQSLKGENYWKFKHEDVIEWERMMGKLSNILYFAAEHVFQQGLGFTTKEIFEDKILMRRETSEAITTQIWQEVNANGVTRKDLVDYFATKGKKEGEIDQIVKSAVLNNLLLLVTPTLQGNGIQKERLYLEIPKYFAFDNEPLYFDEAKQKYRANKWYGALISHTIGKVYPREKAA